MTSRQELAWSALARKWDSSGAQWNQPVAERLIELTELKPGMTVADLGCGTGAVSISAARIVHPARVSGIDSSAAMVIQAKQRAEAAGVGNVLFWCEDAVSPSLAPGTFDAVLSSMVVAYLPRPSVALHAWRDLLKPGGTLAFSWVQAEDRHWQPAYDAVDAFLAPGNKWADRKKYWTVAEAEAEDMLPGMEVSTTTEGITTRYRDLEHWWVSSWTQAPAIAWAQIPAEFHDSARQAAFAELRGLRNRDGSLERTRTVGYTVARIPG
jgi:ubiquinone/menaquinone biosynthesis C-methylase UbiE